MRTARLASLVAALTLTASIACPRPSDAATPVVSEGPRVRIECGVQSQPTADKARAVVEAALALAEARLPYKLPEGRKIVVHLHPEAEAYQDAVAVAGEPRTGELSKSLIKVLESHVLMAPRSDAAYLALVDDLSELTRYHLAYTTVIQLLRRVEAPSLEWWPAWYLEGLSETIGLDVVAAEALAARSDGGKRVAPPLVVAGILDQLRESASTSRVLPVPRLLFAEVIDITLSRRIQAHWVGLFRVFESEPEKLVKLHDTIRRLPPPPLPESEGRDYRSLSYSLACAAAVYEVFGSADVLDAKLRAFAASVKPSWFDVLHWSQFSGDELVCAAPADSTAVAISDTSAPGIPFSIACEMYIHDFGPRQAEIYLGYERRDDPRFVKLTFQPEFVTLLVYSDGVWQDRMRVNVKIEPADVTLGSWLAVKVSVANGILRVDLRDKKLAEIPAPAGMDLLRGRVGFGSLKGMSRFRKIVVAPLPEPKPADAGGNPPK